MLSKPMKNIWNSQNQLHFVSHGANHLLQGLADDLHEGCSCQSDSTLGQSDHRIHVSQSKRYYLEE